MERVYERMAAANSRSGSSLRNHHRRCPNDISFDDRAISLRRIISADHSCLAICSPTIVGTCEAMSNV